MNLLTLPRAEAERLAYAEGFAQTAELFARLGDLEGVLRGLIEAVANGDFETIAQRADRASYVLGATK